MLVWMMPPWRAQQQGRLRLLAHGEQVGYNILKRPINAS